MLVYHDIMVSSLQRDVDASLTQNWSADVEASDDRLRAYRDNGLMAGALNYPIVLALIA